MLLMVEKCIRGEISNFIYRYAEVNNKYIKDYDKNKELSYFWDVNNLCGWAILEKLRVNNFECIKDTSQFNENFIKTIMKKLMKDISLKLMFNILKNYMNFLMFYRFYQQES